MEMRVRPRHRLRGHRASAAEQSGGCRTRALVLRTIFIVLALLFMTLPALNLVTLNLSRILERAPEIGVRKAFGAPKRTLIAQFVTENVILTLIGGALGFVFTIIAADRAQSHARSSPRRSST